MQTINTLGFPRRKDVLLSTDIDNLEGNIFFILRTKSDIPTFCKQFVVSKSFEATEEGDFVRIIDIYDGKIKSFIFYFIQDTSSKWITSIAELSRKYQFSGVFFAEGIDYLAGLESILLGSYQWDVFSTKKQFNSDGLKVYLNSFQQTQEVSLFESIKQIEKKVTALYLARDLTNLPPNYKTPQKIAEFIKNIDWKHTDIQILNKDTITDEKMGLLLAVSKGSDEPPVVIIFKSKNNKDVHKNVFVGKGVTFDAGGLQIKPDTSMFDMKSDMAGAAAVLSAAYYFDCTGYPDDGFIGIMALFHPMGKYTPKIPVS